MFRRGSELDAHLWCDARMGHRHRRTLPWLRGQVCHCRAFVKFPTCRGHGFNPLPGGCSHRCTFTMPSCGYPCHWPHNVSGICSTGRLTPPVMCNNSARLTATPRSIAAIRSPAQKARDLRLKGMDRASPAELRRITPTISMVTALRPPPVIADPCPPHTRADPTICRHIAFGEC